MNILILVIPEVIAANNIGFIQLLKRYPFQIRDVKRVQPPHASFGRGSIHYQTKNVIRFSESEREREREQNLKSLIPLGKSMFRYLSA